jgi:dTDP-3-amino-2,3,6-trideoxy-4-keto-D-glucose/dTDP-3-amino-3,4,6-trideoxy-alpha-D-glucose/dTDP-2,6-dideoxy-D-kanosamine transaminase
LFLALKALGIGPGDEVITVANTAVPTVAAIRAAGALPVFVDVEEDTFLMDVSRLEAVITEKTKCILPVHLYGQPVDMDPLMDLARKQGLFVVEDCAQAAGARYKGRRVGSIGDIGAFSFYPTKVLGGYGDAGMTVTNGNRYEAKLRRLRFYGMKEANYSEEEGYNSRLDEVHAAILNYKLRSLDEGVRRRQAIAAAYTQGLAGIGDVVVPAVKDDRSHQFYVYTIQTEHRDVLMRYLHDHDVEARINYPTPVHLMRGYAMLGYRDGELPMTERLTGRILSLPLYPGLTNEQTARITEVVRAFYEKV